MSSSLQLLSKSYKIKSSLKSFFNGNKLILSNNELFIVTIFNSNIYQIDMNGKIMNIIENNSDEFITFILANNDNDLLIACKSGLIKHYKLNINNCVNTFKGHEMLITNMSIDPTNTLLATSSIDRTIRIWHIEGGYCTHSLRNGHQAAVRNCWFANKLNNNNNSLILISSDDEGGLCLWVIYTADSKKNLDYNERDDNNDDEQHKKKKKKVGPSVTLHQLKSHMNLVTSVAFSYEYNIMVSVGRDSVLNIWNLTNYELIRTIPVYEVYFLYYFIPYKIILGT